MTRWTTLAGNVTLELPDHPTPQDVRAKLGDSSYRIASVAIVDGVIGILSVDLQYLELRPDNAKVSDR